MMQTMGISRPASGGWGGQVCDRVHSLLFPRLTAGLRVEGPGSRAWDGHNPSFQFLVSKKFQHSSDQPKTATETPQMNVGA